MYINRQNYTTILNELKGKEVELVAVSKTKPVAAIQELYDLGQRDFGENYVQELIDKYEQLPATIRWHFIGHLQTNKVKYIAPFVYLIHGVDSEKLLKEISKQATHIGKVIKVLLQVHIATEATKFGLDEAACLDIVKNQTKYSNVSIEGLMAMASFTENAAQIATEFDTLVTIANKATMLLNKNLILSFGMSSDYKIAIAKGSTMVRIGSLLFGERNYESKL